MANWWDKDPLAPKASSNKWWEADPLAGDAVTPAPDFSNVQGDFTQPPQEEDVTQSPFYQRLQNNPAAIAERQRQQERIDNASSALATYEGAANMLVDTAQSRLGGILSSGAGVARGLSEIADLPNTLIRQARDAGAPYPFPVGESAPTQALREVQEMGDDIAISEMQEAGRSREEAIDAGASELGLDFLNAAGDFGTQIAAMLLTRSPGVGLGVSAGQVYGPEYARRLSEGFSREEAAMGALTRAGVEVGTNVPALGTFGRLFGQTGERAASGLVNRLEQSRVGRGVIGGVAEGGQEMAANTIGQAVDYGIGQADTPFTNALETLYEGGIGAGIGGLVGLVSPGRNRTGVPAFDAGLESVENAGDAELPSVDLPEAKSSQTPIPTTPEVDTAVESRTGAPEPIAGAIEQLDGLDPSEVANAVEVLDPSRGRRPERTAARIAAEGEVVAQMLEEGTQGNNNRFAELMAERGFSTPITPDINQEAINAALNAVETIPLTEETATAEVETSPVVAQEATNVAETATETTALEETDGAIDPLAFLDTPPSNVAARVAARGEVVNEMAAEGWTGSQAKRRAEMARRMTERGFPEEAAPDATARTERPRQQAPIQPNEAARVQRGNQWVDATVVETDGEDAVVQFNDGQTAVKPVQEVERRERASSVPAADAAITQMERTPTPTVGRARREVLAQLREEGRVGDTARFNELMGNTARPPMAAIMATDTARSFDEVEKSRIAPPERKAARQAIETEMRAAPTAVEALAIVKARATTPQTQRLISALERNNLAGTKIAILNPEDTGVIEATPGTDLLFDQKTNPVGVYDSSNDTIYLKGSGWNQDGLQDETVLHEIVHAATVKKIDGVYNGTVKDRETINAVNDLIRLQRAFQKQTDTFSEFDTDTRTMLEYAGSDPHEFIAVTQTSPTVQAALKEKGLWDRFIDLMRRILGLSRMDKPMLEKVLDVGLRVIEAKGDTEATAQEAPRAAIAPVSPEVAKYTALSERIAQGTKPVKEETREKQRQSASDRALVRNIRLNMAKEMDVNNPGFNEAVGRKAAELMERREIANRTKNAVQKTILEAQGKPEGFTPTAKKVLKGQTIIMKGLKNTSLHSGWTPKEIFRNVAEIPEKKMDGIRRRVTFITADINRAMGLDPLSVASRLPVVKGVVTSRPKPSAELSLKMTDYLRGLDDGSTLSEEQKAALDSAKGHIDALKLETASVVDLSGEAGSPLVDEILSSIGGGIARDFQKNHFKLPFYISPFKTDVQVSRAFYDKQKKENPLVVEKALKYILDNYYIPDNLNDLSNAEIDRLAGEYGIVIGTRDTKQKKLEESREGLDQAQMDALIDELFAARPSSPRLAISKQAKKAGLSFNKYAEVPVEIREAWGEYTRPQLVVASIMNELGEILSKNKALNWIAEAGTRDGYVFDERPEGSGWTKLRGDKWGAMKNKYVNGPTKVILDTYVDKSRWFNNSDSYKALVKTIGVWGKVNAIAKLAKTAGSLPAIMTQALSNVSLVSSELAALVALTAPFGDKTGLKSIPHAYTAMMTAFKDATFTNNKDAQDFIVMLTENGALRDGVTLGEARSVITKLERDLRNDSLSTVGKTAAGVLDSASWLADKMADLYQLSDNPPKIFSFLVAREMLPRMHPDWSQEQIDNAASDRVMDRLPTFSRAFPIVRLLSRVFGNYATWPGETVRTSAKGYYIGSKDIIDGVAQGINTPEGRASIQYGAAQLVGTTAALVAQKYTLGAFGIASAALMQLAGDFSDDEEEREEQVDEDVSAMSSEFYKNADLQVRQVDQETNSVIAINVSRMHPYAPVVDAYRAFERDGADGVAESVRETVFAMGMVPTAIVETVTGEDMRTGKEKGMSDILIDAFAPGQLAAEKRALKAMNAGADPAVATAMAWGAPLVIIDGKKEFPSRMYSYKDAMRKNQRDVKAVLMGTAPMPDEAIEALAADWIQQDKENWNDAFNTVTAAQRTFGMGADQLTDLVKDVGVSEARLNTLLDGNYDPLPSKSRRTRKAAADRWWNGMLDDLITANRAVPGFEDAITEEMNRRREIWESTIENWNQYVEE